MSLWSRLLNIVRGDRLSREIDEEIRSHLEEAIEQGRDPAEARRAFGSALRHREESRDIRLIPWLDSLRADIVFGLRQLNKNKVTSAAAILSLALAIGACTSAFRLIDALLLRPLPIAGPDRLYALSYTAIGNDGKPRTLEGCEYPMFLEMRRGVKDQAELLAVSFTHRTDLTYASGHDMEKAYLQHVSGWMFDAFGLRPALGRLFTENDDHTPGAHPYAVLSYYYWSSRFGQDRNVIGRVFRMGNDLYEIVGVAPERFTGTETGTRTDIFVPTMMHPAVTDPGSSWIRILVHLRPGIAVELIRERLHARFRAFRQEKSKGFTGRPQSFVDEFVNAALLLDPAAAGVSRLQKDYRRPLVALGLLVGLVLLIACANVANLMTAQAAARSREMALRVSIGAGRWRLVQLVLVESALLALLAATVGGLFAWWSAPFVVSMITSPNDPVLLALPADWRVFGFGLGLTLGVAFLLGLAPALGASAVKPASALKGGEDPHSRRRLMHAAVAVQAAFCFLVLFVAGLFVATFDRLSNQPTGFSAERILNLETVTQDARPPAFWDQVINHLRDLPGVESVALAGWPLLTGESWVGYVSMNGEPPGEIMNNFLPVSPGWLDAMKIPLTAGRDFLPSDSYPGAAIVNEAFKRQYFSGENPIGRSFESRGGQRFQIVGVAGDALYRYTREPILPTVYVAFRSIDASGMLEPKRRGTFIVRTSGPDPLALAQTLRREVARARPEFQVSSIRTQAELIRAQTVRERLLAMLALFFAVVGLLLAGVGLYGVLDYSVLQGRREIGIRMAIGAQAGDIVRRVTTEVLAMVLLGALLGLALGMASLRYIETLLYEVKATDLTMVAVPAVTILTVALLAALPPVIRAVRTNPVTIMRAE